VNPPKLSFISTSVGDLVLGHRVNRAADYFSGGIHLMRPGTSDAQVIDRACRPITEDAGPPNQIINTVFGNDDFQRDLSSRELPKGYVDGACCVIRPKDESTRVALSNPHIHTFEPVVRAIFEPLGQALNLQNGQVKLTTYGRHSRPAELLSEYTPHARGLSDSRRGCGGPSPYTATGIMSVLFALNLMAEQQQHRVTLIGADGALGRKLQEQFLMTAFDLAVADINYQEGLSIPPDGFSLLPAERGRFADECLVRGGIIIAATSDEILDKSNWHLIPPGSYLILAHDLSLNPSTDQGLVQALQERKVTLIPSQLLMLGYNVVIRLEDLHLKTNADVPFKSDVAGSIVWRASQFVSAAVNRLVQEKALTPFEATWHLAGLS